MSLELLEKLESKVQAAVDTIGLLQMEIEELKADKVSLSQNNDQLQAENARIKDELGAVQGRINAVLGKIAQVDDLI